MKLAIMQPYIFPYIGYFQLVNAVDKFIVYDDVNFIKQGWINRNRLLVGNKAFLFTIPLKNQSSFELIKDTQLSEDNKWRKRMTLTIEQSYSKAPFFPEVINVINKVLLSQTRFISQLALTSILETCNYLGIHTEIALSSDIHNKSSLTGQERIIDICRKENATKYYNSISGTELYSKDEFNKNNIDLSFIRPRNIEYQQFKNMFIPGLSIIDVMMFNHRDKINAMLEEYDLE